MSRARATLKLVPTSREFAAPVEFGSVFEQNHAWVAAVAARLTGRRADVEDIVQEVFLLCARKIESIPSLAEAKPWLRTVTVRTVRKKLRRRKWQAWFLSSDDGLDGLPYAGLAPDEHVMLRGLYAALKTLPVDERLAWTLRHVEGASLDEVAEACGCSLATVKRRITRASATLERDGHVAHEA